MIYYICTGGEVLQVNYVSRMLVEYANLKSRIERLSDFTHRENILDIVSKEELLLMTEQLSTMSTYLDLLRQRINLNTEKID